MTGSAAESIKRRRILLALALTSLLGATAAVAETHDRLLATPVSEQGERHVAVTDLRCRRTSGSEGPAANLNAVSGAEIARRRPDSLPGCRQATTTEVSRFRLERSGRGDRSWVVDDGGYVRRAARAIEVLQGRRRDG